VKLELPLNRFASAAAMVGAVMGLCAGLLYVAISQFVLGSLIEAPGNIVTDAPATPLLIAPFTRDGVSERTLEAAVRYFPNSSRLQMRLAQFGTYEPGAGSRPAELHAALATRLSPHDYRPRLLLASIQHYEKNLQAAEQSAREALRLAPSDAGSLWELASVLLERGDMQGALKEFRSAASVDESSFQTALDVIWRESGKSVDAVRAITPNTPKDKLELARFLLKESRQIESAAVFGQIDPSALLRDRDAAQYLNSLIAAGHATLAWNLWLHLVDKGEEESEDANFIWNGGFETDIPLDFAQFDWSIQPSDYARISIDGATAHRGKRSLRVDFLGRDTTRLEDEIKQLVIVYPGRRYRLSYYARTQDLSTPEGPRVTVSTPNSREWIAASDPAKPGSTEWQRREFEFKSASPVLVVAITQRPRFSYEDPTRGVVWFDDFEVREIR
jgi:tetratricopeptide (TPR) repeat protein